jgi:hypothetical protein
MAKTPIRVKAGVGQQRFAKAEHGFPEHVKGVPLRQGLAGILANFQTFVNNVKDVTPGILEEIVRPTFEKSQMECPQLTGELVQSGYFEVVRRGPVTTLQMGYGRNNTPDYAIYVHEMPYKHAAPTKAKFLQGPLEEDMPQYEAKLAAAIRRTFGT